MPRRRSLVDSRFSGFLPSEVFDFRARIETKTVARDDVGETVEVWRVKDGDQGRYGAVPCAVSVAGLVRFARRSTLRERADVVFSEATPTVLLRGFYPDITDRDRAVISRVDANGAVIGVSLTYKITGADSDSQAALTRLATERVE